MKTNQIFVLSALIISVTFLGVLSMFNLPESVMEWVISNFILGVILFLSYLVMAMAGCPSKTRYDTGKKLLHDYLILWG